MDEKKIMIEADHLLSRKSSVPTVRQEVDSNSAQSIMFDAHRAFNESGRVSVPPGHNSSNDSPVNEMHRYR